MQIILVQTSGGEELKLGTKKSFCTYHEHETRGVDCVELESTWKGEEKPIRLKEFRSKRLFHFETGGNVLTPFFSMCQSVGQAADEGWAGAGSKRKKGQNGPLG